MALKNEENKSEFMKAVKEIFGSAPLLHWDSRYKAQCEREINRIFGEQGMAAADKRLRQILWRSGNIVCDIYNTKIGKVIGETWDGLLDWER